MPNVYLLFFPGSILFVTNFLHILQVELLEFPHKLHPLVCSLHIVLLSSYSILELE